MASVRSLLLDFSAKLPGSRVLDDHYGALLLAVALRKGQPGLLAYVSEFIAVAEARVAEGCRRTLWHARNQGYAPSGTTPL